MMTDEKPAQPVNAPEQKLHKPPVLLFLLPIVAVMALAYFTR
jgi:hypothetical protein